MGGSSWSDTDYSSRVSSRVNTRGTKFAYDADVRSGKVATKAAETLDPKGVTVRESRDSDAHPTSNAIGVGLDVTGSMGRVSKLIHDKLPTLMGLLTRKNYIADPQIMFSAIGDVTCDRVPLQVGQFESGAEMEGDLSNFFLEGGGGGQRTESYELYAYFMARHTAIDCMEKRNKRGYLFIIGDEMPYPRVKKPEVQAVIGGGLEADIPTPEIFKELSKKYLTFYILPEGASYGGDETIIRHWADLLGGEHVLQLKDPEAAAELIATQIGLCEGTTDLGIATKDLADHGTSEALVKVVESAVSRHYLGGTIAKTDGLPPSGGSDIERL